MMRISLKQVNLIGNTSVCQYSLSALIAGNGWELDLLDGGIIHVKYNGAQTYIGPGMWKTADVMDAAAAQTGFRDTSNIAAISDIPAPLHLTTDGTAEAAPLNKEPRRKPRKGLPTLP